MRIVLVVLLAETTKAVIWPWVLFLNAALTILSSSSSLLLPLFFFLFSFLYDFRWGYVRYA